MYFYIFFKLGEGVPGHVVFPELPEWTSRKLIQKWMMP